MKVDIILYQDEGIYRCLAKERPPLKIEDVCLRTKKECLHYALDRFLEAPKKYKRCSVYDKDNNMILHIER